MFSHPRDDWAFYLLGALLTLAWKLSKYIREQKAAGRPARQAIIEWFFEASAENAVSWITTIAVVWVIGDCYLRRVPFLWDYLGQWPVEKSIAFLLGSIIEIIAPNVSKWILAKLPGQ
jgi:hypothetical protein